MKKYSKTKIASAISAAVLVVTLAAPANAAVSLGGENGWEVTYGGFINLFYNYSNRQSDVNGISVGPESKSSHMQEGLLPSFHTMTAKSPEVGGLRGTAQITFAVDASAEKSGRLNKSGVFGTGSNIDMREVFFNVEGSFGTISAGRTLSLFQRQAILKDYTLFGMGAIGGQSGGGTGLGRIGYGYVYPDFRTRFTYKTPDMNGFQVEVGIFDPQEPLGDGTHPGTGTGIVSETDSPQFQMEATYNTAFEGGSVSAWAGLVWQRQDLLNVGPAPIESTTFGYNVGIDVTFSGFNLMGSYYGGEALGTLLFNLAGTGDRLNCGVVAGVTSCQELDADGFIAQGSYTINGKTKIGGGWGRSSEDGGVFTPADQENTLITVGVYHDVTPWLKLVAEWGKQESETKLLGSTATTETDLYSIGGFVLW